MLIEMSKKKILFFHFDMQGGGAEKVLVNMLKQLNPKKYDITLQAIFGVGVNLKDVPRHVHFQCVFRHVFRGFSTVMKLMPPWFWHGLFVRGRYDVEIAYLESSPSRILSGCKAKGTKKVSWIHTAFSEKEKILGAYRSQNEAIRCFNQFDKIVFVSQNARDAFLKMLPEVTVEKEVLYNINDFDRIYELAKEPLDIPLPKETLNLCAVGRLTPVKGYGRLIMAVAKLRQDIGAHFNLYVIGMGEERRKLENLIGENGLQGIVHLLGFKQNPYQFISRMDLCVCSSYREGYSTATTEAIALGVPVITTAVSGMDEILENGKSGLIVPNTDEGLLEGLMDLLSHPEKIRRYAEAIKSASRPTTRSFVDKYEEFLDSL